jgi:prevent-host-death family protein
MATITAFEAKTRFGELLNRAEKGEEITITRYDKPVARIVPEPDDRLEQTRKAFAELDKLREGMRRRGMKPLTVKEIRSAINEGRR